MCRFRAGVFGAHRCHQREGMCEQAARSGAETQPEAELPNGGLRAAP